MSLIFLLVFIIFLSIILIEIYNFIIWTVIIIINYFVLCINERYSMYILVIIIILWWSSLFFKFRLNLRIIFKYGSYIHSLNSWLLIIYHRTTFKCYFLSFVMRSFKYGSDWSSFPKILAFIHFPLIFNHFNIISFLFL